MGEKLRGRRGWSAWRSAIAILSLAGVLLMGSAFWAIGTERRTVRTVPLVDVSAAAEYPDNPFTVKLGGDTALGTVTVRTAGLNGEGEGLYYYESIGKNGG